MRRLVENADQLARQQQKIAEDVRRTAESRGREGNAQVARETLEDKLRLLESLGGLERQINEAARRMAANQRKATQKLRGASSLIQEQRMADKIRQGAWLAQRRMWPMAVSREDDLQADTEQLREQVRDAQRSLQQEGSDDKLREALAVAERLRQELESIERQRWARSQNSPGDRGAQRGEAGSQAGRGDQTGGDRRGSLGFGNPSATWRDGLAGTRAGRYRGESWNPGVDQPWARLAPLTPEEQRQLDQRYRELAKEASGLRQLVSEDPEFERLVRELVGSMQALDSGRFPGNPAELERLRAELLDRWRELELRLSRHLQVDKSGAVRLTGLERIPERYRSILEEYYRSISRSKR